MFKHLLGKHDNLNLNYFSCTFNNCSYFFMNYFYKIKYNSVSKKTEKSIVLKSIYKEYVYVQTCIQIFIWNCSGFNLQIDTVLWLVLPGFLPHGHWRLRG